MSEAMLVSKQAETLEVALISTYTPEAKTSTKQSGHLR